MPASGVSANRMLSLMTTSKTTSPYRSRTSSNTSCECSVLDLWMVARMPLMRSCGLSLARTRSIVLCRSCMPFIPKYSHCSGMMTSFEATSALTQRRPREGGQSITMKSYSSCPGRELLLEEGFAPHLGDELDLGARELDVRRNEVHPEIAVLDHVSERDLRIEQQVVERELDLIGLLEAHVDRQVALWIEVDEEDALPELSECASEVHRGGRFANPAFLVGNRDDSAQTVVRPLCWNVAAAI